MIERKWTHLARPLLLPNSNRMRGNTGVEWKLPGFIVTLISSNCKDTERIFSAESKPWSWATQDSKLTSAFSFLCYIKTLGKARVFAKFRGSLFLKAVLVYILTCRSAPEPGAVESPLRNYQEFWDSYRVAWEKSLRAQSNLQADYLQGFDLVTIWFCMFAFRNQPLISPKV